MPVLVATGRRIDSSRRPLAAVGLAPPAVVLNGALGPRPGHRCPGSTGRLTGRAKAAAVLAAFTEVGLQPVVHVDGGEVDGIHALLGPAPTTHPEHAASFGDTALVGDLAENLDRYPVLGFSVIGVDHAACVAAWTRSATPRTPTSTGRSTIPVWPRSRWHPAASPSGTGCWPTAPPRASTPAGCWRWATSRNDLELLDKAAVALVPEVAHREALARADSRDPRRRSRWMGTSPGSRLALTSRRLNQNSSATPDGV